MSEEEINDTWEANAKAWRNLFIRVTRAHGIAHNSDVLKVEAEFRRLVGGDDGGRVDVETVLEALGLRQVAYCLAHDSMFTGDEGVCERVEGDLPPQAEGECVDGRAFVPTGGDDE